MRSKTLGFYLIGAVLLPTLLQAQIAVVGGEFQVNSYTSYQQGTPSVAVSLDGSFVVTWSSGIVFSDEGIDVRGQRYSSSGARAGAEFLVNTYTTGNQSYPSVGIGPNGAFVVAWQSDAYQDGEDAAVLAQRYASDGTAAGSEFVVNTYTTNSQFAPAVGVHSSGSFVIVWESNGQDGSFTGVFAQQFAPNGTRIGTEFQVNSSTNLDQSGSSIGMDNDGAFVVAWQDGALDGSSYGVYAQRFASNGTALGTEFRANTVVAGGQSAPSVGVDGKGSFAVAWQSDAQDGSGDGIFVKRYGNTGAAAGAEFRANTITVGNQRQPSVGPAVAGGFVVTWQSDNQDGSANGVFARRFSSTGTAIGTEFQINTYTASDQYQPSIGSNRNGNFAVAWTSIDQDGQDGGIFAQRFAEPTPTPFSGEFQVNSYTTECQSDPDVEVGGNGTFVIAWSSAGQDYPGGYGFGIFAQRFGADALPLGSEFQVNTYTYTSQRHPSVGLDDNGAFVIAWDDLNHDNSGYGIFAQRYDSNGTAAGGDFQINSYTTSSDRNPSIGMNGNGAFTVAWQSSRDGSNQGVFGQRFNSAGAPVGTEFQINSYTTNGQARPSLSLAASGAFVVSWDSVGQDGPASYGVFAQRFASDGTRAGTEFQVSTVTAGQQYVPVAGSDKDGNFVIAWQDLGRDGSTDGVFAQRFVSDGTRAGTEFQVNSITTADQFLSSLDVDAGGSFVVAWQSYLQDGSEEGIFRQRFNADGSREGTEFQVNSFANGRQYEPAVGLDGIDGFVVTWTGGDILSENQDGHLCGVFAKRISNPTLTPTNTVPATATPTVTATSTATTTATVTLTPPPAGACPDLPDTCQVSAKGKLILKDNSDDTKDKIVWKFGSGPALMKGDFGDPTTSDVYAFCVYDNDVKIMELSIPAGTPWEVLSTKGYQYKDTGGVNDGVNKIKLIGGALGKSKLQLKGKGAGLGLPMPAGVTQLLSGPVVAQLRGNNTCWETSFTQAQSKHRVNTFKGKF